MKSYFVVRWESGDYYRYYNAESFIALVEYLKNVGADVDDILSVRKLKRINDKVLTYTEI